MDLESGLKPYPVVISLGGFFTGNITNSLFSGFIIITGIKIIGIIIIIHGNNRFKKNEGLL